jgi:hypothetical protein
MGERKNESLPGNTGSASRDASTRLGEEWQSWSHLVMAINKVLELR